MKANQNFSRTLIVIKDSKRQSLSKHKQFWLFNNFLGHFTLTGRRIKTTQFWSLFFVYQCRWLYNKCCRLQLSSDMKKILLVFFQPTEHRPAQAKTSADITGRSPKAKSVSRETRNKFSSWNSAKADIGFPDTALTYEAQRCPVRRRSAPSPWSELTGTQKAAEPRFPASLTWQVIKTVRHLSWF